MGGGQTTSTQQQAKVELPAWVDQSSQENYQFAKDVAGRPLQQYEGQRVADPSAMTTQGYGLISSSAGQNDPTYQQAKDIYGQTSGPLNIQPYLSPYTNEVEQRAIGNANTSLTQQLANQASQAKLAGAFGGSRFGVQQGVTSAQGIKNIGDLSAQLRQQGFDTATQTALQDRTGMQNAAAGLTNVANARGASTTQDITNLLTGGSMDTASRQKVIDAAMQKFQEAWQYPTDQLNMRLAALGMSPYGKTTSTTGTQDTSTSPDFATLGLGVLKTLPALMAMSDRNAKTDIQKLTDGDIPMYAYRYKGDPKTYPKIVGPMAQDIEKKFPSAVTKVGRHKVVNYSNLLEVLK